MAKRKPSPLEKPSIPTGRLNASDEGAEKTRLSLQADNLSTITPRTPASWDVSLYDPVKVNNANLTELKFALDDAVRKLLSSPDFFTQNHFHTDVRLVLGWTAVAVAAATGLYSWKITFNESKIGVTVGVVIYMALSALQMVYAYFIEGNTVFVGKRKTLAKRIETERLTALSKTTRPQKDEQSGVKSFGFPTLYPRTTASYLPPHYDLSLHYTHTASGGKSLISKADVSDERCYADFFDEAGTLDYEKLAVWVYAMVERVETKK